jgi:hypothetical protein
MRCPMARGENWTPGELEVIAANPGLTSPQLAELLPGRTVSAIGKRRCYNGNYRSKPEDHPAVKEPGEYLETLTAYFADHFDCLEIWLRWNGYATCRELSRDMKASPLGVVTLLCTAKA